MDGLGSGEGVLTMAHNITEHDLGFVTGGRTWHGRPEYHLTDAIGIADAVRCVDYPVRKLQAKTQEGHPIPGGYYAARMDTFPPMVLAPNLGERYELTDRRQILDMFDECLLAAFPDLKIAGVGTLSAGRTFWLQLTADHYNIRGDHSDHELRLCYSETYGLTAHEVFCTHTRIVCDNTLQMARGDAIAGRLMAKCRHTKNAEVSINAVAEDFAELKLGLKRDIKTMEALVNMPVYPSTVRGFLDRFIPVPTDPLPGQPSNERSQRRAKQDRESVLALWEKERDSMNAKTAQSRYGLMEAYADWADHHSYSRSPYDRWLDGLNGDRAKSKAEAMNWLLAA